MLACLHNPVQHVQCGFIPLDTQQQRCGHPCLKSQWSSTAQSDIILGISATSSVTTDLLSSSLHFTSMCFSYLSFWDVGDCSVAHFLLIYFSSSTYFSFSQDRFCHSSTVPVNRGRTFHIIWLNITRSLNSWVGTNELSPSSSGTCSLVIIYI